MKIVAGKHNLQTPVQFRAPQQITEKPPLGGFSVICCGAEKCIGIFCTELKSICIYFAIHNAKMNELSQQVLNERSKLGKSVWGTDLRMSILLPTEAVHSLDIAVHSAYQISQRAQNCKTFVYIL